MKRVGSLVLLLFNCLCLFTSPDIHAEVTTSGSLGRYMSIFDYSLPSSLQEAMHTAFVSQTIDCGEVQITLEEMLYDGRWLYTSALAIPTNPEATLILPGSALLEDKVAGGYKESLRTDSRTFIQAAADDQKKLLAVYAYPSEFDQLPFYVIDHVQDANERSILVSAGKLESLAQSLQINWSIQIYEVNVATKRFTLVDAYTYPVTVECIGPVTQATYTASDKTLPFQEINIIHTSLTTYAVPSWRMPEYEVVYEFSLLDSDGQLIEVGARPDVDTFTMEISPETLSVQLTQLKTNVISSPIQFTKKSEESVCVDPK